MGIFIEEIVPAFHTLHDEEQTVILEAAEKGRTYFPEDSEERQVEQTVRDLAYGWLIREANRNVMEARANRAQQDSPVTHEHTQQ